MFSLLRDNNQIISEVKALITDRVMRDEVKENAFNNLYAEMKAQKEQNAIMDRAIKPIFLDILLFYDNLKKFEGFLKEPAQQDKQKILAEFGFLLDEVLEILYRQDVERIASDLGKFDKKFQKAIKTEATASPEENFDVHQIIRDGFTWRDHILRPQEVVIKKFTD